MNFRPLTETHPELTVQWDAKRNGNLKPGDLGIGSPRLVWWICAKGHYWQQMVNRRRISSACSFCLNQRVWAGENDLATTNPSLAEEWHPTKNAPLSPRDVSAGTPKKYWWICPKGHEWIASADSRNRGTGCGVCANRQIVSGVNDLAYLEPEVARDWHPTKNGDLLPSQVGPGSNKAVWWICGNGHEWRVPPTNRCFRKRTGCAVCSNQKVLEGFNDLATTHPALAAMWHPSRNGDLKPQHFVAGSPQKFWWMCDKGHSFQGAGDHLVRGRGCAVCAGRQIEAGVNDLASLRPDLAQQWDLNKNTLDPTKVTIASQASIWWLCHKGHSYRTTVSHRTVDGTGCPYCDNKKVLRGFNDLATTHPDVAKRWHPDKNKPIDSHEIIAGTATKYWWMCDKGHEYKASGDGIMRGNGCSVCSNYSLVVGVNDLAHTNPEIAATWHTTRNGELKPTDIVAGTHRKIWWMCDKGHEWQALSVNRLNGNNCPSCSMGGFDPNRPGRLYFIVNKSLNSRKVGITNLDSARLSVFSRFGWEQIKVWDFVKGVSARNVEKEFFYWLRLEIGLAPYLDSVDIGKPGGWTETFSMDGVSDLVIVEKVESLIEKYS